MLGDKFSLRFTPKFVDDLDKIVDYISVNLHNPESAIKLANKIEKAIQKRLGSPLAFEPFKSNRKRKHPYYLIYVDNFTIYYTVIDDVMEVRRVLYGNRDSDNILE